MLVVAPDRYSRYMFRRSAPVEEDPFAPLFCSTVLVAMEDGTSLRGVLWERRGPLLVLKEVTLLEQSRDGVVTSRLDGEQVIVERSKVNFIQVITTSVEV